MGNTGLEEAQLESRLLGEIIKNLRNADDTCLVAECEEELKRLLMKVKEEIEKVGLELNIQKTKIMASGPITSWQIDGGNNGNSETLFWGAPKLQQMVTAAIKLKDDSPWNKSYDRPREYIKKQRHYFANKVNLQIYYFFQ